MAHAETIRHQLGNELIEVGFAQGFIDAIYGSKVLEFADESLKDKILSAEKNQLLVLKSTINSPKMVVSVEYYNEEFISNSL